MLGRERFGLLESCIAPNHSLFISPIYLVNLCSLVCFICLNFFFSDHHFIPYTVRICTYTKDSSNVPAGQRTYNNCHRDLSASKKIGRMLDHIEENYLGPLAKHLQPNNFLCFGGEERKELHY